ncbi:hypothetical protein J6590_071969 [Homalodisca vitripennis]|nr:hypothetical protein J6590_071969 [Homalodisca vitripennis]
MTNIKIDTKEALPTWPRAIIQPFDPHRVSELCLKCLDIEDPCYCQDHCTSDSLKPPLKYQQPEGDRLAYSVCSALLNLQLPGGGRLPQEALLKWAKIKISPLDEDRWNGMSRDRDNLG